MDKITEMLNNFSLDKYIPKLDTLMGWVQWLVSLAVRVGPICILVLGLIYLLIPPKEANRKAGFRTYFGMGSISAWRFTQRIAGILMVPTGLILTIIAYGKVGKFPGMDLMTMAQSAYKIITSQVICALVIYVVMFLLTVVLFDRKGYCRFQGTVGEIVNKLTPREAREENFVSPANIPEPVPEEESYETQGSQTITADDIVIEDI